MITETGENLSVLIVTETAKDWQTFATWYSAYKNLPDASVSIVSIRNKECPFQCYQWTKRLQVPTVQQAPFSGSDIYLNRLAAIRTAQRRNMVGDNLLILEPLIMCTDAFDPNIAQELNHRTEWIDEDVWFLKGPDVDRMMDEYTLENTALSLSDDKLCFEAKHTEELVCLVSYKKGCGKWIHTSRGCPFSSAAGLVSTTMTANERRVIEMWKKMVPLYNTVN